MSDVAIDGRLPRGRHGMTRDEVSRAQRGRMLRALADAMAERGYVGATVADVIARAGVSRETFYQQFASKQDCFMSALDAAGEILFDRLGAVLTGDGSPIARFDRAFAAYLETLATEPSYARLFLVEVYAAGPEALDRRAALQQRIVDTLVAQFDVRTGDARFACEVLVAGIGAMVTRPIVAKDPDAVRALRRPIVELVGTVLSLRT